MPANPSNAEQIYNHALHHIHPFASSNGHAWAAVTTGPLTHQVWPLASADFRAWLAHSFLTTTANFPSHHALRHAIQLIQARARYAPHRREDVFTRVGWRGNPFQPETMAINLANSAHEIVEISPHGWRITTDETWRFRSPDTALPLAAPKPPHKRLSNSWIPGVLDSWTPSARNRLLIWLVAALRPVGPYPILILSGPQASGKSTIAGILRNLIDPAHLPLQIFPKTERELFVMALHSRVLAFDHVPSLTSQQSVALARMAAGAAFNQFGRHPFDEPLPFTIERPVILTVPSTERANAFWNHNHTISSLAITVNLDEIDTSSIRSQREIACALETATPAILALLCDATTAALANIGHTSVNPVSRFVDLQQWAVSAAPSLGLTEDEVNASLAATPLVRALTDLLTECGEWTGAPSDLLTTLHSRSIPDLPPTTKSLTQHLNSTPLAVFGIRYSAGRKTEGRHVELALADFTRNVSCFVQTSVMNSNKSSCCTAHANSAEAPMLN